MKKFTTILTLLFVGAATTVTTLGAQSHPKILVQPHQRQAIVHRIETQEWAKNSLEQLREELWPYVSRYAMTIEYDPAVLTSRYRMNWNEGFRYTDATADETGLSIAERSGDAPYPTVRYTEKGYPTDERGFEFLPPSIEELPPYDSDTFIRLRHPLTGVYVEMSPKEVDADINRKINAIALKSAILYWITREEEYGYLAADLLNHWMRAASHQNPVDNGQGGGLFGVDVADDAAYNDLLLTYDFIYDFLVEYNYETTGYQAIFEKMAGRVLFHGSLANNGPALSSATLVFSALNIDNPKRRQELLNYFVAKDTIIDKQYGNHSLKTIVAQRFTPQGYWKSPARYQNELLPQLLMAVLACENNGIPLLKSYPLLADTYTQMVQNAFPNLDLPAFGDTGRERINPLVLQISLALNQKHSGKGYESATDALRRLANRNSFDTNRADIWGLLFMDQSIEEGAAKPLYWQKQGEVEYARNYFVRSGMNPNNDQMVTLQGGTFANNHADGLSMELFDKGVMLGSDPGTLRDLNHPLHIEYYAQWAAHNTVVPAGSASPDKLFKGGEGAKSIGNIDRTASATTPHAGFISGRYTERYTKTNQERTVAYIRTSDSTGYFVDIFRSNNRLMNDYIYHNIGDSVSLLDFDLKPVNLITAAPFTVEPDFPGLRFIEQTRATGTRSKGIVARFALNDAYNRPLNVQTLFVSNAPKNYYVGQAPRSITAHAPYNLLPTPTILVRQEGEAWFRPFTAVMEAYRPEEGAQLLSAEWEKADNKNRVAALRVTLNQDREQFIFQSPEPYALFRENGWSFSGYFGLLMKEKGSIIRMEMAKGKVMGMGDYTFTAQDANATFTIEFLREGFSVTSNQTLEVRYAPYARINKKNPQMKRGNSTTKLVMKRKSKDTFLIPPVTNGVILL